MPDDPGDTHGEDLACIELVELVTDHLEGALPPDEARRFAHHLETCPGCSDYVEQMRAVAAGLGGFAEDSIAAQRREALIAAFRDSKKS